MSDIEEDIKILEDENQTIYDFTTGKFDENWKKAYKNIIEFSKNASLEQKQDKEKIQELEKKQKEMCEEYCPKTEKIKELEAKLEFKNWGDLDNTQFEEYMNGFIPKQKLKDKIDRHKIAKEGFEKEYDNKHYEDDEIRARDFYGIVTQDRIIQVLEELLENK